VNNSVQSEVFSYKWILDGTYIGSDPVVSFDAIKDQDYTLQLAAQSINHYRDTSIQIINIAGAALSFTSDSIANVFTPNYAGINDDIDFSMGNDFVDCSAVYVYNRWGALIFESIEGFPIWVGRTFVGKPYQEGIYFYRLEVNGTNYTGYITLLR
jgi:gliding motility-associated-like protein|tara:strand:+ start:206 stop:670 length:465 start_codon:yes stop_codon:yes gene_type:complete